MRNILAATVIAFVALVSASSQSEAHDVNIWVGPGGGWGVAVPPHFYGGMPGWRGTSPPFFYGGPVWHGPVWRGNRHWRGHHRHWRGHHRHWRRRH